MVKITIIDCGMGNRESIRNMLKKTGYHSSVSQNSDEILSSDLLILPGIGSFDAFMQRLADANLLLALNEAVLSKKIPILGICLGMQILFDKSEEGSLPGLGWIDGKVSSLSNIVHDAHKLPHIGWKAVQESGDQALSANNKFYFVHSYHCQPTDQKYVTGQINLNEQQVVASVQKDNIFGVQFHPEKSHKYGLIFFSEFINNVT